MNNKFKIIEPKCEYFNALSRHFVGIGNPFLFVFVLIWHFYITGSHFDGVTSSQWHWEDAPAVR